MTSNPNPSDIAVSNNTAAIGSHRLPGDFAMWALIIMELSVFALLFLWYAFTQRFNPDLVAAGRLTLSTQVGLICTFSLLTGSYLVALAVTFVKHNHTQKAFMAMVTAIVVASVYLVAKIGEYQHLIEQGFDLGTNRFYTLYFFTTFFHMMHVIVGMGILGWLARQIRRGVYRPEQLNGLQSGAAYWHMVDLVWVILFFIIYVSP